MYIQIDNTGFKNKGAELMLVAIMERLSQEDELHAKFVFGKGKGKPEEIRRSGLYQKANLQRYKIHWEKFFSQKRLEMYGLVKPSDIQVVLDAGGFSYGDQWQKSYSASSNLALERYYASLKRNHVKIIFLPQAFGPFKTEVARDRIQRIYPYIDIFFARDVESFNYMTTLFGEQAHIKLAPDFTSRCRGKLDKDLYNLVENSVVIIPNNKMLSHTESSAGEAYQQFLITLCQYLHQEERNFIFLNHGGNEDYTLIKKICLSLPGKNPLILNELDAKTVKGVIYSSYHVISSRFHGAVSALSQGIPTLCTSWSHKYQMLLEDYACQDCLLPIFDKETSIKKIQHYLNNAINERIRCLLREKSEIHRTLSENMWQEVIHFIKKKDE